MTSWRHCTLAVLLALSPSLFAATGKTRSPRPAPDNGAYKGAIVVEATSGQVLFEDRADVVSAPASMTKLMTFAVLYDRLAQGALTLATPVRITNEDWRMGGTQVFLDPRETFPVEELIYAMMIQSANDAAHALARIAGGSVGAFVALMNAKARELGMTHTMFRSPHGLPPGNRKEADGDLTTPRDFAALCQHLIANTDVLKYSSVTKRNFGPDRANGPYPMSNHNNLLGKVAGVDGLKTGFTDNAGYCISATAQRAGRRVIAVVMGSLGPGGKRDLGRARDVKTIELLERGFAALPPVPAGGAPEISAPRPVPLIRIPTPAAEPAAPAAAEPMVKLSVKKK